MTTKHTQGPWVAVKHCPLDSCDIWEVVAEKRGVCSEATESDAAHIVRCVNAHDGLLAALRELQTHIDYADFPYAPRALAVIAAALAKAGG